MAVPLPVRGKRLLLVVPVVLVVAAILTWLVLSPRMEAATPVADYWVGEYFGFLPNQGLDPRMGTTAQTRPVLVRNDDEINFEWGKGSPAQGMPTDRYSIRWTRTAKFDTGVYRFHAKSDDGVRLYIDDQIQVDRWSDNRGVDQMVDIPLEKGNHKLRVEYYENWGDSSIRVWWEPVLEASIPLKEVATASEPFRTATGASGVQAVIVPTAAAAKPVSQPTVAPAAPAGNLLQNGSFEAEVEGTDQPVGWRISIPDSGVSLVDDQAGAKSQTVLAIKPNLKSFVMTQEVEAKAGEAYDFTGSVNIPSADGWFRLAITLVPLNEKGEPLATYDQASFAKTTDGWSEVKNRMTAPSYTTRIRAQIKVDVMRATAFLDNLQLKVAGK